MGGINKIKELIGNNKREIRKIDNDGNTKLHLLVKYHCVNDYIDYLKRIIRKININHRNNMGETPLITLIKYSNVSNDLNVKILTRIFVDSGADINIQDVDGRTALIYACKNNNIETARILILNGANINIQDYDGKNALMHCCISTINENIIKLLLDHKPDLTLSDIYGKTIFMHLAYISKPYMDHSIFCDLSNSTILNSRDNKGMTALIHACINSSIDMVSFLVYQNININSQDSTGRTALMYACMNYNSNTLDIIQLLIDRNVDFNIQDFDGMTCLMYASLNKSNIGALIVDVILKYAGDRIDIDKQDSNGMTALIHACISNNINAVSSLVIKTNDINIKDNKGMTALMYASLYNNSNIVYLLLKRGADPSLQDMKGKTALMHAVRYSAIGTIRLLLGKEVSTDTNSIIIDPNINAQDINGKTALFYAIKTCDKRIVRMLLRSKELNLEVKDIKGRTVLIYTSQVKSIISTKIIKILLSKEPDINASDISGTNALMYACINEDLEKVKILLKCNPDIDKKDNDGYTALMHAYKINQNSYVKKEIINKLLKKGADIVVKDNCYNSSTLITACKSYCDFNIIYRIVEALDKISDDEYKILEKYINNKVEVIKNEIKNINSMVVKKKCNITNVTQYDNQS
jgi:ankyrin repeat protein